MAAGLGYIEFTTGDILTASAANGYLASQTVMVFASAAARTSAITSPQEGMISYLKDTNAVEKYTGAAWESIAGAPPAGGFTLISTQTLSAAASLNVNSCFSATYKNYQIIYNMTSATTSDYIYLKLRASGTDSSTAYYGWLQRNFSSSGTQPTQVGNINGVTSGFEIGGGLKVGRAISDLQLPFEAVQTSFFGVSNVWDSGNTRSISQTTQGIHDVSTSYDGFSLIPNSGTMTGTVYIYGYGI